MVSNKLRALMKSNKHFHNCCMDYGNEKSECRFFETRVWDKKSKEWKQKVDNIVDAMEALRDYKQISTGLHHYERRIIVLDIDNENWEMYEKVWADKFPKYNYRLENPDTKHAQYGWILKEPLSPQDPLFKQLSKQIRKLVNFLIKKEFNDESKIVDAAFTSWRCKNPLYNKFTNVVLNLDELTDVSKLVGAIKTYEIGELTTTASLLSSSKQIAKENHIKDPLTSRNEYLVENLREEIWKVMRAKGRDNVTLDDCLMLAKNVARDAVQATSKFEEETEREIYLTAKSVFVFCREKFNNKGSKYNDLSRRISTLKRKYKVLHRLTLIYSQLSPSKANKGPALPFTNDIQMNKSLSNADRLFILRCNKLDKQELRDAVEEYAERMKLANNPIAGQVFNNLAAFDVLFSTVCNTQYEIIGNDSPNLTQDIVENNCIEFVDIC